jgi:RHS repeat-associated protein
VDQLLADEQVDWSDSDADGEVLWTLTDHLGTVRDAVDSAGVLRIHKNYDAFGGVLTERHYRPSGAAVTAGQTGYVDEAFGFTGRFYDKATGLQNNLHRWYDASTGRWLSEDPIGFGAGDANLYRYVGNSPTMYTDPTGLYRMVIEPYDHGPPPSWLPSWLHWTWPKRPTDEELRQQVENFSPADLICPIGAVGASVGRKGAGFLHHIATNKNFISKLSGGPWSQRFEKIFRRAGMTLKDAANKVRLPAHKGPHPEAYHREVFDRLNDATRGLRDKAAQDALTKELGKLGEECATAGTRLNKLLTQ